jgi:predicted GNAT family N-acyltransferase
MLLVSAPLNWQIDYVVVRDDARGQGIATSLVNATVNQALARHVPYVMLTSKESLRPLYAEQCGFTPVAGSRRPHVAGANHDGAATPVHAH